MSELSFRPTRGTGALVSIAALVALNGLPAPHLRTEAEVAAQQAQAHATAQELVKTDHERKAREAIAARFASCAITSVHSDMHHITRDRGLDGTGDPRGRLSVSVRVTGTDTAEAYLEEYDQNDAVTFDKPEVRATILDKGGSRAPGGYILSTSIVVHGTPFDGRKTEATGHFTPRVYEDGTEAAVFASQEAATYAHDLTDNKLHVTRTTGETFCGTIALHGSAWVEETPPVTVVPNSITTQVN